MSRQDKDKLKKWQEHSVWIEEARARKKSKFGRIHPLENIMANLNINNAIAEVPEAFPVEIHKSYNEDLQILRNRINSKYIDFQGFIIASNVFTRNDSVQLCIPSEIGVTKFTLRDGVIGHYHEFYATNEIPPHEIPTVIEYAETYHQIQYDSFVLARPNQTVDKVKKLFDYIHIYRWRDSPVAYLFCDDKEYEQIWRILQWMMKKAEGHGLNWNIRLIHLSTLFKYFYVGVGQEDVDLLHCSIMEVYEYCITKFATLCSYHKQLDCLYCAKGRAHSLTICLLAHMCPKYQIDLIKGKHKP